MGLVGSPSDVIVKVSCRDAVAAEEELVSTFEGLGGSSDEGLPGMIGGFAVGDVVAVGCYKIVGGGGDLGVGEGDQERDEIEPDENGFSGIGTWFKVPLMGVAGGINYQSGRRGSNSRHSAWEFDLITRQKARKYSDFQGF